MKAKKDQEAEIEKCLQNATGNYLNKPDEQEAQGEVELFEQQRGRADSRYSIKSNGSKSKCKHSHHKLEQKEISMMSFDE